MKYLFTVIILFSISSFVSCTNQDYNAPVEVVNPIVTENQLVTKLGEMYNYAPESSGVILSDGFIYTFNDSGNPSIFYKVNPENGTLIQSISVSNYDNKDWEDITADNDYIYIGDFGNNEGIRTDLRILKISKSQFINNAAPSVSVTAELIQFSYAEQTSFLSSSTHNFDCESIISKGDQLYIFTKDRGDNNTRVYKLSKQPGNYVLSSQGTYQVNGLITGGDYNAQTNELVLIGYTSGHKNSFIYHFSNFIEDAFFGGKVQKKVIGNATNDWQTEGIAFASVDGSKFFISCETTNFSKAKLYKTDKIKLGF